MDLEELKRVWGNIKNSWESYRLVMEDLFLRGTHPSRVVVPERDRNENVSRLVGVLKWLVSGSDGGYHVTGKNYLEKGARFELEGINEEELKNLKIEIPHGMIFNFLQNCVSNATRSGIRAKEMSTMMLKIAKEGDNLVFSVSDNGVGLQGNEDKVLDPGFSTKTETGKANGKGLAYADKRFEKVGGSVDVLSPDMEEDWSTTFKITVPIVKE